MIRISNIYGYYKLVLESGNMEAMATTPIKVLMERSEHWSEGVLAL